MAKEIGDQIIHNHSDHSSAGNTSSLAGGAGSLRLVEFTASAHGSAWDAFLFGPFKLLPLQRQLQRNGESIKLGGRAFDLLVLLVSRANQIIGHRELLATIWSGVIVEEGNLRFQITALRKALGDCQPDIRYVLNVPGRGYCFVAPVTYLCSIGKRQ